MHHVFESHVLAKLFALVALFPPAALGACGEDDAASDADTRSDTSAPEDTSAPDGDSAPTPDTAGLNCEPLAPGDLEPLVFDGQDDVSTSYSFRLKIDVGVPAADYLVLQFINYNERIEAGAGTFALDEAPNDNFGTCPECVALWVDQPTLSSAPGKILFQSSGQIRLDVDPRSRRLIGELSGVVFREIALDEMTLSSVFVEGGDCFALTAPLAFDFRYVPPEWTCGAATYQTDDGCDCGCGTTDPDCYPTFESPIAAESSDCGADQRCYFDACVDLCAVAVGDTEARPCPTSGEVCVLDWPVDVCRDDNAIDAIALGGRCTNDRASYCAPNADGMQTGICDFTEDRTCRALCASRADCAPLQHCYTVAGGYLDGEGKGFCNDGVPPAWACEPERWNDGATCDCDCGDVDPDCEAADCP